MNRLFKLLAVAAPILLLAADAASTFKPHQLRWWAIQKAAKPTVPEPANKILIFNEIDAFVLAKLETAGLTFNPEADRSTWLRRVSLDLTGLPPSPEETQTFLTDTSKDAHEKVV